MPTCACGCGAEIPTARFPSRQRRYVHGHNARGKTHSPETIARMRAARLANPIRKQGEEHPSWNGGRKRHVAGYVRVWLSPDDEMAVMRNDDGYVLEHRLVVARDQGEPLPPECVVHHVNGVKDDNRRENLEVYESQAAHTLHHVGERSRRRSRP